jgi:hypothetical protein
MSITRVTTVLLLAVAVVMVLSACGKGGGY